jgi:predicted DCC family thiol-disulfide oxidoreductase YuxK
MPRISAMPRNTAALHPPAGTACHNPRVDRPDSPTTCTAPDGLTVLYDGACPLCRREIGLYRGLEPTQQLAFLDISDPAATPAADLPEGLPRSELLARFHVRHADGRLESGARAFISLWDRLPYWRWLARVGRLPGIAGLMEIAYRGFLRVRPTMQRWAGKRG